MIKISSFSLMQNFSRWGWEFYDDRLVVKTKSLTLDIEKEIKYEKIQSIRNNRTVDLEWLLISFAIIVLLWLIKIGFDYFCVTSPAIGIAEKGLLFFALILIIPVFRKQEHYWLFDADKNLLVIVRVVSKDKQTLLDAIQLIKQKNETIRESYFDDHLPGPQPVFQFTEFNFADFLNKSTVRFYDDKIVDVEKSLMEETTIVIEYAELNGKTTSANTGNDKWNYLWFFWLYFVCLTAVVLDVFFAEQVKGSHLYLNLVYGGFALLIPLYFLTYIKSEVVIFNDKKDNGVFWASVNSANREKLDQIIGFVQEKVALQK